MWLLPFVDQPVGVTYIPAVGCRVIFGARPVYLVERAAGQL